MQETTKVLMRKFVDHCCTYPGGYEAVCHDGPIRLIDTMLKNPRKKKLPSSYYEDLINHRSECEKFLAALLGMV